MTLQSQCLKFLHRRLEDKKVRLKTLRELVRLPDSLFESVLDYEFNVLHVGLRRKYVEKQYTNCFSLHLHEGKYDPYGNFVSRKRHDDDICLDKTIVTDYVYLVYDSICEMCSKNGKECVCATPKIMVKNFACMWKEPIQPYTHQVIIIDISKIQNKLRERYYTYDIHQLNVFKYEFMHLVAGDGWCCEILKYY